jgi:elongation factor P
MSTRSSVILRVVQTEPGIRGDTATAATKPATLETGAVVHVPLFVEEGTLIKVDTRTFSYLERVK